MNGLKTRFRLVYDRAGRLDKNGKAGVVIEAYLNGKRKYIPTRVRLRPDEWNEKKAEVRNNPAYNRLLRKMMQDAETFELTFPEKFGRSFRLADLDLFGKEEAQAAAPATFSDFALACIERKKNQLEQPTYWFQRRAVGYMVEFNGGKPVAFSDLTYAFVVDFDHYLREGRQGNSKRTGYKVSYVEGIHKKVKQYIGEAIKKKLFDRRDDPYEDFTAEKPIDEREVFHADEIRRIESLQFTESDKRLEFYRDAFLTSFYTLLRIGDLVRVSRSHIRQTDRGMLLELKAEKTSKINRVPLSLLHKTPDGPSKPERLVAKYMPKDDKPLFDRSPQKINENVKVIFKLAGIDKPEATFHTSRHSGITYLLGPMALPVPYVQKLAQHANIQTTMHYAHIANRAVEDALDQKQW